MSCPAEVVFRTRGRRLCEICSEPIPPEDLQTALVPDSSNVDLADSALRGRRLVHACGEDHMNLLVRQAQQDWVDEQWWFGLLCQASVTAPMTRASLSEVARRARLSGRQLAAALNWNAARPRPRARLPGGQPC